MMLQLLFLSNTQPFQSASLLKFPPATPPARFSTLMDAYQVPPAGIYRGSLLIPSGCGREEVGTGGWKGGKGVWKGRQGTLYWVHTINSQITADPLYFPLAPGAGSCRAEENANGAKLLLH
jgi:hypothetical protein